MKQITKEDIIQLQYFIDREVTGLPLEIEKMMNLYADLDRVIKDCVNCANISIQEYIKNNLIEP